MTASALITFSDGRESSSRVEAVQELEMPPHLRQSIHLTQQASGAFKLVISNGLLAGKSWESITIKKQES